MIAGKGDSEILDIKGELHKALGLQKSGKTTAAADIYERVLKLEPDNVDALHLLGLTHYDRKKYAEARELISSALNQSPHQPSIQHNMAAVLSIQGEIQAAEGYYREAIRLKPDYAEAYYNLSAIMKLRHSDPIINQIEDLLSAGGLSRQDQCYLHFAAGKLLDDLKKYDRAFAHYQEANQAREAIYDRRAMERYLDAMRSTCHGELLQKRSSKSYRTTLPVFIVGMPRSGTTLLEQILASHPRVYGAGELKDISSIGQSLKSHSNDRSPYPLLLSNVGQNAINGMAKAYIEKISSNDDHAVRVINKMPLNFWHLGPVSYTHLRAPRDS